MAYSCCFSLEGQNQIFQNCCKKSFKTSTAEIDFKPLLLLVVLVVAADVVVVAAAVVVVVPAAAAVVVVVAAAAAVVVVVAAAAAAVVVVADVVVVHRGGRPETRAQGQLPILLNYVFLRPLPSAGEDGGVFGE